MIRRREFITLLGGAGAWPLAARAQQGKRMRHLGILSAGLESDAEARSWRTEFVERLRELGWTERRNLIIDYRFGETGMNRMPDFAKELTALQPDVILAIATNAVAALRQNTFSIPIVFVQVPDPIEIGFVMSFARPAGNITGFTNFDPVTAGKWLQMLKDVSSGISRVVVVFDPDNPSWVVYVRALEASAPSLGVRLMPAGVRDIAEIGRVMETSAREGGAGLVVLPGPVTINNRESLIRIAARYRLPAIYPYPFFIKGGGLISYGPDLVDQYRRAAGYVDRILKGEKPTDLPVQNPIKYELVINLKTAKALGIELSPTLLARADEVIE